MKLINGMSGVIALVAMLAGCADMSADPTKNRNWRCRRCRRGRHNWRHRGNAGMGAAIGAGLGEPEVFSWAGIMKL